MKEQDRHLTIDKYCKKYNTDEKTVIAACEAGHLHATRNNEGWSVDDEAIDNTRKLYFFVCVDAPYGIYDLERHYSYHDALFQCECNNWTYEVQSPRSWETSMYIVVSSDDE